jgi:uncharacterized protein (DUF1778 family)
MQKKEDRSVGRTSYSARPKKHGVTSPLMVRLDEKSKALIARAAKLRRISLSDYVRTVIVAQARREVEGADQQIIIMTPEEQKAFWEALNTAPKLTPAQKRLGAIMRGEE